MKRREFILLLGGMAAWPLEAQRAAGGEDSPNRLALEANLVGPFREGLRDLGHEEGRNIVIEYRWAEGKYERFPAPIAELIASKVDVIVTAGPASAGLVFACRAPHRPTK
jgi:putative tryptophan/tyrosine transport system substrate-binding protein